MIPAVLIRRYHPHDASAIARLFHETVRTVNLRDYTPEQVAAWAGPAPDPGRWGAKLGGRFTVVAADDAGAVVGFTDLEPDGHLDHLFVHHAHQRRGIATALHAAAEAEARRLALPRMFTEASLTARPFFLRAGYRVLRQQTVTIGGVALTNFAMEKVFDPDPPRTC